MGSDNWQTLFTGIVGFSGSIGLLALVSPRAFAAVSALGNRILNPGGNVRSQDLWVDIDEYVLSHGRLFGFGVCCATLYLWLISTHGPEVYSKSVLLPIVAIALIAGIVALRHIVVQKRALDLQAAAANTDSLTGLANRRVFDLELDRRLAERQRRGKPLGVMIVDIDRFKSVNDDNGHLAGDIVLTHVARIMQERTDESDLVARLGGDEFSFILADRDMQQSADFAEQLRAAIEQSPAELDGVEIPVTISAGVATAEADDEVRSLLKRTDSALYAAKEAGRNLCFRQGGPEPAGAVASRIDA